jgi:O-methyltransferase
MCDAGPAVCLTNRAAADLYLDLLAKCLTRLISPEQFAEPVTPRNPLKAGLLQAAQRMLSHRHLVIARRLVVDRRMREEGLDWPAEAETMIGLRRLENVRFCVEDILLRGVAGDLIEAGVWRGGAAIFMRAVLKVYGDGARCVWLADSFDGLPAPNPGKYPYDAEDRHWQNRELAVPLETVRDNFVRYGLLDDRVRFVKGWFSETLSSLPVQRLSLIRLDADMYGSTIEALTSLYPKLSPGGYLIVDDYGAVRGCRQAVDDYRRDHDIRAPLRQIDGTGVFWQHAPE